MYQQIEQIFQMAVRWAILILEAFGAGVILVNTFRAIVQMVQKSRKASRLTLFEGIASGLTFLLSSEVLKTIIAPDWNDVGITCAVLVMRAGVTVLIRWEEKQEGLQKKEPEQEANQKAK